MNANVDEARLRSARTAIRTGEFARAALLLAEWDESTRRHAPWLNVLGVLAVARWDWKQAAGFWRAAGRADKHYAPAQQNLRRYYELFEFGRSAVPIALGDEIAGVADGR
jgi:hypothetical protein